MSSKRKGIAVEGFMRGVGSQSGLTLLELCIAILILAILVSIGVPVLLAGRKKADRVTAEYNLKIGGSCLDRLYFKMLDYSHSPDGVDSYRDFGPLKTCGAAASSRAKATCLSARNT